MKFSFNWLQDFVEIPFSATELADRLSLSGHEVEEVLHVGDKASGIVTGRLEKIEKHPDADRLVITTFNDGTQTHQILTAATNVFEGAIVPASLPGAILADGTKIKSTVMRGIDSHGMLCSQVELGVSDESDGIWILPEDTPLGVDVIEYFHLKDSILDVGILPNRGDCMSHLGLARDIAALLEVPLKLPDTAYTRIKGSSDMAINLVDPERCPLYTGQKVINLDPKAEPPQWMKQRLTACGVRPISLIVDITNYVMLEFGQPLHAFDCDSLTSNTITVRRANEGEVFTTLDDQERTLSNEALLICDGDTPVALAGIMGGANSEMADNSTSVYLEAALFESTSTRKTGSTLGLRSESSMRYEKGIDPEGVEWASDRALHLIETLAGGQVTGTRDKSMNDSHPYFESKSILFSVDQLNQFLGAKFTSDQYSSRFEALGIKTNSTLTEAVVPSWRRFDMVEYPCLAEEAARLIGFDNIAVTLPQLSVVVEPKSRRHDMEDKATALLVSNGFLQTTTYPMVSPQDMANFQKPVTDATWTLLNPISVDESVMRESLLPSLLKVASHNLKRQQSAISLFEMAKTYHVVDGALKEEIHLVALHVGPQNSRAYTAPEKANNEFSVFDMKHLTEQLLSQYGLKRVFTESTTEAHAHPKQCLNYLSIKDVVGQVASLHPMVTEAFDIEGTVTYMDLNLSLIEALPHGTSKYKPFSKFPSSRRDIALLAPKSVNYGAIVKAMEKGASKLVSDIALFDLFESEKIGADNRSLAFAVTYQVLDRTLSDDEVNQAHQALVDHVTQSLPVTIR